MKSIPYLAESSVNHFRKQAFEIAQPRCLPRRVFEPNFPGSARIPAIKKWFRFDSHTGKSHLNKSYMGQYGDFLVPVEMFGLLLPSDDITRQESAGECFQRGDWPFSKFLDLVEMDGPIPTVYIAQHSITSLPPGLQKDLPVPDLVRDSGQGDLYDSSIWIGTVPTFTPLHKDPNPNLFVQMAGEKVVRMYEPSVGQSIFVEVQRRLNAARSASFRGEEMMHGKERSLLETLVWDAVEPKIDKLAFEATLESGDCLFIPQGWWHSFKGHGLGINGSVNWWFR